MYCNNCYNYPCVCVTPCSTLPCNVSIKEYTNCPQDCYQVWVGPQYNWRCGSIIPGHYEYICKDGKQPPQPQPYTPPQPETHPPIIGGCAGTRYGCCTDGITPKSDENGSNCSKYVRCLPTCPYQCNPECIHYRARNPQH